ncbi:MAG TPA: hypothetical protein ENN09_05275 [Planctomycetes bacterium]|nr:hypothetical protein [Planctomycetota bacterium]
MTGMKRERTKEDIIRAALRAYPDTDMLAVDVENAGMDELLEAAAANEFGDTLVSFIVTELYEGTGDSLGRRDDFRLAAKLMERAAKDLKSVAGALKKSSYPPRRQ